MRSIIHNGRARVSVGVEIVGDKVIGTIAAYNDKLEDSNWSRKKGNNIANGRLSAHIETALDTGVLDADLDSLGLFRIGTYNGTKPRDEVLEPIVRMVKELTFRKDGQPRRRTTRSIASLRNRLKSLLS